MNTEVLERKKIKDFVSPGPTDREISLKYEELFFSVTDLKSHITYANDVFVRISRYEPEEIIGQLHKLIRHPEMPRCVFNIFWDFLKANKPVAAYVKNLAKDGSFYWVMALAFPCEGGYLSIRLRPGSKLFTRVKNIYAEVLRHEKKEEQRGDKKKAMHSAHQLLLTLLQREGFNDYEEFMWIALQEEMNNRGACLEMMANRGKDQEEKVVPTALLQVESILCQLVRSLEKLKGIHESLAGHSDYILKLARSILLLSLNAQIGSSKLDQDDLSLSVVAEKMGEQSVSGEKHLIEIKENIHQLSRLIGALNFDIISAKLQAEMAIYFHKELHRNKDKSHYQTLISSEKSHNLLYDAFTPTLDIILGNLGHIPTSFRGILHGVKEIERFLMVLRFIHITGKVEVARMNDEANSFATTFQDLVREIETAERHLKDLTDLVEQNKGTAELYTAYKDNLEAVVKDLDR